MGGRSMGKMLGGYFGRSPMGAFSTGPLGRRGCRFPPDEAFSSQFSRLKGEIYPDSGFLRATMSRVLGAYGLPEDPI